MASNKRWYNPGILRPHRMRNLGSSGPTAFTPSSIAGMIKWHDITNLASVTKDGSGNVSQWNDLSGNAYHATQPTAANQPLYGTGGLNSQPKLSFNGTTHRLITGSEDLMTGAGGGTLIVVCKPPNDTIRGIISYGSDQGVIKFVWLGSVSSLGIVWGGPLGMSGLKGLALTGSLTSNIGHYFELLYNGSGFTTLGNFTVIDNHTSQTTQSLALGASTNYHIGYEDFNGTFFNGEIYEIAAWGRQLTVGERSSLSTYYLAKYGL